jgi:hypothetical protein
MMADLGDEWHDLFHEDDESRTVSNRNIPAEQRAPRSVAVQFRNAIRDTAVRANYIRGVLPIPASRQFNKE